MYNEIRVIKEELAVNIQKDNFQYLIACDLTK